MWATLQRVRRSRTTVIIVVSIALFTDLLLYGIVVPILPDHAEKTFNASSTLIGLMFASYALGLLLGTPIFGILADKIGRKPPMVAGLLFLSGSTVLYGFGNSITWLLLARFAQGVSGAASFVIGLAMIADIYPPQELGSKMGLVMGINGLGMLIGPTIGGAMYEHISYSTIFIICGGFTAFDAFLRVVLIDDAFLKERYNFAATATAITAPLVSEDTIASDSNLSTQPHVKLTIWTLLLQPQIMISQIGVALSAALFAALEPTLTLHLQDKAGYFDFSSTEVGLCFLACVFPYMFLAGPAGYAADKYDKKVILAIGLFGCGACAPLVAVPHVWYLEILTVALMGTFFGVALTPSLPEISQFLEVTGNQAATAQGYALFNFVYSLGMMGGPALAGYLYDKFGFLWQLVFFGGLCCAWSPVVLWYTLAHPLKKLKPVDLDEDWHEETEQEATLLDDTPRTHERKMTHSIDQA